MVTLDDSESEKWSSSHDKQANIYLMEDTDDKVEVKACSKFDTSSCASPDDEEDMPIDVSS